MTDLALIPTGDGLAADLGFGADLETDDGLRTAVLMSVWTDAPANQDDLARFGLAGEDPRGWWADSVVPAATNDVTGSQLWLLARAKQTEEVRRIAVDMARKSLALMVEDGVASTVTVIAEWRSPGVLAWRAQIERRQGGRFDVEWLQTMAAQG